MCGVMIGTSPRLSLTVQMCGVMIGTSPRLSLTVQMCCVMIGTSPRLSLIVQMCGVMIGGFLVCWTPYTIISTLSMCGVGMSTQVATLPTMFAKLSCALNPVIYVSCRPSSGRPSALSCPGPTTPSIATRERPLSYRENPNCECALFAWRVVY